MKKIILILTILWFAIPKDYADALNWYDQQTWKAATPATTTVSGVVTVIADRWLAGDLNVGISTASINIVLYSTGGVLCAELNTGQGMTEVYLMNQNVRTTDNVSYSSVTLTGGHTGILDKIEFDYTGNTDVFDSTVNWVSGLAKVTTHKEFNITNLDVFIDSYTATGSFTLFFATRTEAGSWAKWAIDEDIPANISTHTVSISPTVTVSKGSMIMFGGFGNCVSPYAGDLTAVLKDED